MLSLPAELRNAIYEEVAGSVEEVVVSKGIANPHALTQVCSALRKEFSPVFKHTFAAIPIIKTKVVDLHFTELLDFLSQHPNTGQTRKLYITVESNNGGGEDWESVHEWFSHSAGELYDLWFEIGNSKFTVYYKPTFRCNLHGERDSCHHIQRGLEAISKRSGGDSSPDCAAMYLASSIQEACDAWLWQDGLHSKLWDWVGGHSIPYDRYDMEVIFGPKARAMERPVRQAKRRRLDMRGSFEVRAGFDGQGDELEVEGTLARLLGAVNLDGDHTEDEYDWWQATRSYD